MYSLVPNKIIPSFWRIKVCSTVTRFIFSSVVHNAGFQGKSGQNYSLEQRQNMMERKKRLIRKLENMPLEMKPIKDFYIPYSWRICERRRKLPPLTEEEIEQRILLKKEWSTYVNNCKKMDDIKSKELVKSQSKALYELRKESEELYNAAIECDTNLLPFTQKGPLETPPIKGFMPPLGAYVESSENYD